MEFMYLFNALMRRKWIILLSVAIAVLAAYVLTSRQKQTYRSVAQIATGFTTAGEVSLTNERYNEPQAEIKFNNVIENFASAKVLSLLSYNLLLHDLTQADPFKKLTPQQKQDGVFKKLPPEEAVTLLNTKLGQKEPLNKSVPQDAALMDYIRLYGYNVENLKQNLQVARVMKTDYINIIYTSGNPELSAYAANAVIREFESYFNQNKQQRSDTSIANLDTLVQQKKRNLDTKVTQRTDYLAAKGIVNVNMESNSKTQQIADYESQLSQEKGTREDLTYRIGQFKDLIAKAKGGAPVASNGSTSDNLTYLQLRTQRRQVYTKYIQAGSDDAALRKQLEDLDARMAELDPSKNKTGATVIENTGYINDLVQKQLTAEGQLRASQERIAIVQSAINQLKGGLSTMASTGANLDQLERDIEITQTDYNNAKEKLIAARNMREMGLNSFTQTLIAQPALQPEPTHRGLMIALAGIIAFVLSALVIMLLAFLDSSIRTPSQFSKLTNLKLLGVVNHVKLNAGIIEGVGMNANEQRLRNDTFRELLRKVRYEIENSGKKIFLFTSTEPRQGKTTLIQALSYSLSLVKKKVLIIDTNFCNNDLTVAIAAKPVLEKFHVNGRGFIIDDIKPLITKTSVEGVDMIGCEGGNYTPREILPQNHLLNYLPELTAVYDYIFLEGAPLNDYTDTKELIHYSDGIVAVFSSEASLSATDRESIRFFKQHDNKFLGAILNKVQVANLDM